ncbi:MAG TPA: ATP12 family protein [Xanthobacteraceae bacterium]|nr:ATP12 family protein [Xanthobacteraceae bacterium]
MRDIFTDLFANARPDPIAAARRAMRPPLPRRFYRQAGIEEAEGGFRIVLDGRPVRTPARGFLVAPSRALAQALAAEWDAQGETIDPVAMPLTRLANTIIDGVVASPAAVAADIEKYLGSDLLFYRAEGPQRLVERQADRWDPVLAWAREALGARFTLAQGLVHAAQPESAVAAARAAIPADPWRLGALHAVTTLTGSALLALALMRGRLTADEAWEAAHVDEDWNMEQWGRDEIALERRAARRAEMDAAVTLLAAL